MPPAITVAGVNAYIAKDGGVREAQPYDGPRAHVVYTCPYADRYTLLQGLLPYGRNIPHAYPPSPNLVAMECTGIEGIGEQVDEAGWMQYQRAKVGIEYRIPTWQYGFGTGGADPSIDPATPGVDPSGQPWTTTTVEVSGEVLKLPQGSYVLSDGTPIEESASGIIMPNFTIRIRRHYVLVIPLSWVEARVGCVNIAPVKIGNKVFGMGTLMLGGMTSESNVDTTGQVVNSVEYTLLARGRGLDWNQFLSPSGTWLFANTEADMSGDHVYPYVALHAVDGLGADTTFLGLP